MIKGGIKLLAIVIILKLLVWLFFFLLLITHDFNKQQILPYLYFWCSFSFLALSSLSFRRTSYRYCPSNICFLGNKETLNGMTIATQNMNSAIGCLVANLPIVSTVLRIRPGSGGFGGSLMSFSSCETEIKRVIVITRYNFIFW